MIWGIQSLQAAAEPNPGSPIQLPTLVPAQDKASTTASTAAGQAAGISSSSNIIDVVRDFYWTYSPKSSRIEVPTIQLAEKQLQVNALISQLKYTLGLLPGTIDSTGRAIFDKLPTSLQNAIPTSPFKDVGKAIEQISSAVGNALPGSDNNATLANSQWLQPYRNLYITKPTPWQFLFPYFDDTFSTQTNQFSQDGSIGPGQGLLQVAANLGNEFLGVGAIRDFISGKPQITYIERAKFYNYPTDGEDITFSFPLINTGSVDYNDVVNNWQLVFLLLYNNRPGRTSGTTIDQPVVYEVTIPGVKYFPFCYISSIDVKFQGARRTLPITVPYSDQVITTAGRAAQVNAFSGKRTFDTIIPDAYMVTITLKSMLGNTKNFMYQLIDQGNIVTAKAQPAPISLGPNNPISNLNPAVPTASQNSALTTAGLAGSLQPSTESLITGNPVASLN
jgi:hypothetical protein